MAPLPPFAATLLSLFSGAGGAPAVSGEPEALPAWNLGFGLSEVDGEIVAGGPGYKARFGTAGFEFTPLLGESAPRAFPVSFSLESIRRGGAAIYESPASGVEPDAEGNAVRYPRGEAAVETIESRRDGIEHSFRFDSLPEGAGDLVVRLRIETDLGRPVAAAAATGLLFEAPGLGGVRVGAVTGFDAEGKRAEGWLRFDGTNLEYGLPAAFVESAAFPLVLDPPIGSTISGFGLGTDPDVAYDATSGNYLVVWQVSIAAGNHDVRGQRVSATGVLVGGLISITASTADETDAAVASVNGSDRFLVVYRRGPIGVFTTTDDILARGVNASDGAVSNALSVTGNTPVDEITPDVGGDRATLTPGNALVAWKVASGAIQARVVSVPAAPTLPTNLSATLTVSSDPASASPAVNKHDGTTLFGWLVAWDAPNPPATPRRVWGRVVDYFGAFATPAAPISTTTPGDQSDPDCDTTDGLKFLVVWEEVEAATTDRDVRCREIFYSGGALLASSAAMAIASAGGVDEADPAVGFTGEGYVVAWRREVTGGPLANYDILAKTIRIDPPYLCAPDGVVAATSSNEHSPEVATQWSGSSGGDEALVVWDSVSPLTLLASVLAGRYRTDVGTVENLGGGCAPGLAVSVGCPAIGSLAEHTFAVEPPFVGSPAFLVISVGAPVSFPCGSCVIGVDLTAAFVLSAVVNPPGIAGIVTPIPADLALSGAVIVEQWAIPASAGGCALFGVGLSDALKVTIGS